MLKFTICLVILHPNNRYIMTTEELNSMYSNVCNMSHGNGFRVERMPNLFETSEIDDCMAHVHSFYEILWFQEGTGVIPSTSTIMRWRQALSFSLHLDRCIILTGKRVIKGWL